MTRIDLNKVAAKLASGIDADTARDLLGIAATLAVIAAKTKGLKYEIALAVLAKLIDGEIKNDVPPIVGGETGETK